MLTPTSVPPTFISPEEHDQLTSSTPADFSAIPPVLRFEDAQAEVTLHPSTGFEGWNEKVQGHLWVTEAAVSFLPSRLPGFSLPYTSLTLHALTPASPDSAAHIYCQIEESNQGGLGSFVNGANGDEDDGEYTPMREGRIYVADDKLQALFAALSQCSALHASLMPNGEPSSFFGFGDTADGLDDDNEEWEDEDEEDQGDGGRNQTQVDRFLDLVDWGDVRKPAAWDAADAGAKGEFDDAEEK